MSRRAEIADAAIATIARHGMRGLTHRAVDRAAGLPEGSASYYFRTRQALLHATVERLADLDIAEMPALPGPDLDAFVAAAAATFDRLLIIGRDRQLARYELVLESTRRPELRENLLISGAAIRAVVARQFAAAGISDPQRRAHMFVALLDGLLFDQIAGAGTRRLTGADLREAIATLLAAVSAVGS
jgi:DNA-binding transcriptional regulator YbjK